MESTVSNVPRKNAQIGPLAPTDALPEGFAWLVAHDDKDAAAADTFLLETRQRMFDEHAAEPELAKRSSHTQMIEIASAPIVTTKHCGRELLPTSDHAA